MLLYLFLNIKFFIIEKYFIENIFSWFLYSSFLLDSFVNNNLYVDLLTQIIVSSANNDTFSFSFSTLIAFSSLFCLKLLVRDSKKMVDKAEIVTSCLGPDFKGESFNISSLLNVLFSLIFCTYQFSDSENFLLFLASKEFF